MASNNGSAALARVQRMYDTLASVYPVSSNLFHAVAHRHIIAEAGIANGMRVLEVATGSGEMFRHLARVNPTGTTIGLDLSPKMAAYTQADIRQQFPRGGNFCQAADARYLPFQDSSFDAVVCCYLLELISPSDLEMTLAGFHRVLRPGGIFALTLIGQNSPGFNFAYRICGGLVPAFWGRQREQHVATMVPNAGFDIVSDCRVKQLFYPSRVLIAERRKNPSCGSSCL